MERKRDKFAKLRLKKCSKIDGPAPQITNFFNPKIYASTSRSNSNDTITIEDSSDSNNDIASSAESVQNIPPILPDFPEATTNKQDTSERNKNSIVNEKKKAKKRNASVEKKGPKSKASKLNDEEIFSQLLVEQSMAESVNPDDLQLALALSRSITDTHAQSSSTTTQNDETSNTFQAIKPSVKLTLEEYGFKSGSGLNRNVKNFLGQERESRGFRKMSLLLHRDPRKQNRLFNDKIKKLLEESDESNKDLESSCSGNNSYTFFITSHDLLQCLNKDNGILSLNSNSKSLAEIYSLYYRGNLMEHSHVRITALLRNWDDIPGREMSPKRAKENLKDSSKDEDRKKISMEVDPVPARRSITPDLLLTDDEESTLKSEMHEDSPEQFSTPASVNSMETTPVKPETPQEPHSPIIKPSLTKTSSEVWLEKAQELESVIIIDSDEELEINQSISKILNDHNDLIQLAKKSKSDGFILCQSQMSEDVLPDLEMEFVDSAPSSLPEPNITSLLTGEILSNPPENEVDQEVTFICESLKNQDICVVKRKSVTPPPNFNAMGSEEIQEQLKKYGLKAIKGRKAVILLEHIYNQLHPFIQVEDEMYALKCKYGLIDPQEEEKAEKQSCSQNSVQESSQELAVISEIEHIDIVCRDKFLGDVETKKCILPCPPRKKLPTCALPLHIAFYNYLQSNQEFHEKILQYQPVPLEEIQEHFKSIGIKYENNDLMEFLDKICVTFQGPGKPQARTKKKRAPKTQSTAPASQCGEFD
ncbi:hypothetical protein DMENIID0001_078600 [Sergentomyia squamirostris]